MSNIAKMDASSYNTNRGRFIKRVALRAGAELMMATSALPHGDIIEQYGHGRSDYLCMLDLVKAVRNGPDVPIDVYDAVTWSIFTELTKKSVDKKSRPIDFLDFTKGKWETSKPKTIAVI